MASKVHLVALAGVALASLLAGCASQQNDTTQPQASEPAREEPRVVRTGRYSPRVDASQSVVEMAFPTGDFATSPVLVHQVWPREVQRNAPYQFQFHVTNLSDATLQSVVLTSSSSNNLEVTGSNPQAVKSGNALVWALGDLGANETRVITAQGKSEATGQAGNCVSVSYNNTLCAMTNVVEPALRLTKTATQSALVCDPIQVQYVVTNAGTGLARGVRVTETLPAGLVLAQGGGREVGLDAGDLKAGESRTLSVAVKAERPGTFEGAASAAASGDLKAASGSTTTKITQPKLAISSDCVDTQFVGRNATYTFKVKNTGDGPANNAAATVTTPGGATFVRASQGGQPGQGRVTFALGNLAPGQEREFSITVAPSAVGTFAANATVTADCADGVQASCDTEVRGIPAVLLEVVDVTDPVEVGQNTTYVVTVTNQGSAADTNVKIVCTLPAELEFVSGTGNTQVTGQGREIVIAPLGRLDVGRKAAWNIVVRSTGEGDVRFRTVMTSDNLKSEVVETEATNLYR